MLLGERCMGAAGRKAITTWSERTGDGLLGADWGRKETNLYFPRAAAGVTDEETNSTAARGVRRRQMGQDRFTGSLSGLEISS